MIVKMKFLSISGPRADIDRVCDVYLSKYAMQLENDYLYDEKTGLENLKIFGKYFGFEINDRSDGYCTQLGLTEHLGKRVSTYSKGMKRKLSLY